MANDIDKTSPHYKGDFGSIYEVNKKFPTGGVAGDFVVIEGWAHYWNADRATWCVNAERDSYWDELITNIIEKFKLFRGATYMGVASLDTVPAKVIGAKMYYFATVAGTYKNFGDLAVPQGINVLYSENGSSWINSTLLEVAQELGVSTWKTVSQKALNDALALKANQSSVNEALAKKADKEEMNRLLGTKANTSDVNTKFTEEKTRVDGELAKKFDKSSIAQETGEAEEKVMSQKAVSDKLSDLADNTEIRNEDGATIKTPFREIVSPEFLHCIIDAEDRFLFGIQLDGSIEWSKGIPAPIRAKLQEIINQCQQDKTDVLEAINSAKEELAASITALQKGKVDKEEGKSLIEDEVKKCFRVIENEEFIMAVVDSEDRVLYGIYRATGKPYYPLNEMYHVEQNEEFFALWLDSANHVLLGIRRDGEIIGEIHAVNALKQVISQLQSDLTSLQEKVGTIDTNLKELLDVFSLQDNEEYLAVEQDAEGKILSSTNPDGSHYIHNAKSETIPTEFEHIEDTEGRTEITTDAKGKILGYRDSDGTRHEIAVNTKRFFQNGKEYDISSFVNNSTVDTKIQRNNESLSLSELNGVKDHGKQNLLKPSECTKSYTDGVNTFSPPNAGYILSNPIECKAGDYFTRTGTATGMVVVSDREDKNAKRLMPSGQLPGSTLQIPYNWEWASFIRFAVQESALESLIISKGKYTIEKEESGDFCTIDNLKIQSFNLSNDVAFIKSTDGKYFQLYIDATDGYAIKAKEVDISVIQPNNLPSDWVNFTFNGNFNNLFDRFVICNNKFLFEMSDKGIVKLKDIGATVYNYQNAEHFYNSEGNGRFAVCLQGSQRQDTVGVGFCLFDENMVLIEKDLNAFGQTVNDANWSKHLPDFHDFVYVEEGHYIFYEIDNQEVTVEGFGTKRINGYLVHEVKRINGVYKVIGNFSSHDYPKLYTDVYNNPTINIHMNTIGLDYDGNLILNYRDCDSFIKIRRTVNEDGTVTLGSASKNYDEAIIGRVGGQRNIGYLDSKRVLPEAFSFATPPTDTNVSPDPVEDWQWYHCHDVKYWGMKEINGKSYPTYTMFDNNYWTREKEIQNQRNNYKNNPKCNGLAYEASKGTDVTYKEKTISRFIQISIDWDNKKIIDYKIYEIQGYFSQEMSGATMLSEGIFAASFSYMGVWGVYDFVSELGTTTIQDGKIYKGAKVVFEAKYDNYRYCYRANVYNLKDK